MIKDKEFFSRSIMEESQHHFIYGYNGIEREVFLKNTASSYFVELDKSNPIGIYIYDQGLPEISKVGDYDKIAIQIFNRDYINLLMLSNVIGTTLEQVDEKDLKNRSEELLKEFNISSMNKGSKVETFKELKQIIDETLSIYYKEYIKYIATCNLYDFKKDLKINNITVEDFIKYFKKMIGSNSYICMIFDQQEPLAINMQRAINCFVGYRVNANISMKIACEPKEWKTFYTSNGSSIDKTDDYGIIKLDNSYNDYLEEIKKRRTLY